MAKEVKMTEATVKPKIARIKLTKEYVEQLEANLGKKSVKTE